MELQVLMGALREGKQLKERLWLYLIGRKSVSQKNIMLTKVQCMSNSMQTNIPMHG